MTWVINPSGALTTIEPDHPAHADAKARNNGWREADVAEIAKWAREQSVDLVRTVRSEADRRGRPEPTEEQLLEALGKFYRGHQFVRPSVNDLKRIIADADKAGSLVEGDEGELLNLSGSADEPRKATASEERLAIATEKAAVKK